MIPFANHSEYIVDWSVLGAFHDRWQWPPMTLLSPREYFANALLRP